MASTKKYEATTINVNDASYEVRLEDSVISISNIDGVIQNTLYAKKGATSVKIAGSIKQLDVPSGITSVEEAATAIKSILYVLNVPEGETPENEVIQNAVSIDGSSAGNLTFADIEKIF